jgi:hypothetical protein
MTTKVNALCKNRRNRGKTDGKLLGGVLEQSWEIYETAIGYRASSVAKILGKANYSFLINDKKIAKHSGLDASKLEEDRPELFAAIEKFFEDVDESLMLLDLSDIYGDIAWSQRKPFTPMQQWARMCLYMRMYELEHSAKGEPSYWDAGIRMTYSAIFKFKINQQCYDEALNYITDHGKVQLEALLATLRDFFDGKYAPHNCQTLDKQFDLIAGKKNEN